MQQRAEAGIPPGQQAHHEFKLQLTVNDLMPSNELIIIIII